MNLNPNIIKKLTEEQQYRDSLPSANIELNRHQIKTILTLWEQIAFVKYCIGQLTVWPFHDTYERLLEEEDAAEGFSLLGRRFDNHEGFLICIKQMENTIDNKKVELANYLGVDPNDQQALGATLSKLYTYLNLGTTKLTGNIPVPVKA